MLLALLNKVCPDFERSLKRMIFIKDTNSHNERKEELNEVDGDANVESAFWSELGISSGNQGRISFTCSSKCK